MSQDYQRIHDDNLTLRKQLQLTRHQNDKLQQELGDMRTQYEDLASQHAAVNLSHNQLQRKYQLQMNEHSKDINTLTAQIEELKQLIEQKQLELQNFQIRMIPNLDQDMIRVKLISEMEGPYQETVEKKDREILRLKQKLTDSERRGNLIELQLQTKQKQLKRELAQTKQFYEKQNEKIMRELSLTMNKKEVKTYDKELFRSQRKELEELRCTIDLQSQNETELRKQLMDLKLEKERLTIQIGQLNEKKALEMHLSSQNTEIKTLKQQKRRLQQDLLRKTDETDRLQKRMRTIQKQARNAQEQLRRTHTRNQQQWELQKKNIQQQSQKDKDQFRKHQHAKDRQEEELELLTQKVRNSERDLLSKREECDRLKQTVGELERAVREYQFAKKQKLSLTKHMREQSEEQPKKSAYLDSPSAQKQNYDKNTKPIINRRPEKQSQNEAVSDLEKSNAKLKEKLDKANKKIVELLTEKAAQHRPNRSPGPNHRDRTFSNIEIDPRSKHHNKPLLLQFRDTAFAPLVPPTIYVPSKH